MRNLILKISLSLILVFTTILQANTIHVPADSSTIQGGINGTTFGDTVMVAPGTYHEYDIDYHRKGILVTSEFPEDSTWVASVIVDADSLGRVFHFHTFEDSNSVLKGLTITGGAVGSGGGAGILCDDSSPKIEYCIITKNTAIWAGGGVRCYLRSPKIRNCIITENVVITGIGAGIECTDSSPSITNCTISENWHLDGDGGGLFCWVSSSPIIENCIFQGNSAWIGGGIWIQESSPTIINCTITQNQATVSYGGGVYSFESSSVFINCTITDNTGYAWGGGLSFKQSMPTMINCTIAGNFALEGGGIGGRASPLTMTNCTIFNNTANEGGAIKLRDSSHSINNCTISENTSVYDDGAIYCEDVSLLITNSILWNDSLEEVFVLSGDKPSITYTDIQGGWVGEGNIDVLPFFRDPASDDFHLMAVMCGDSADSPCIDIGTPAIIDSILNCEWGLGTELSDMGAFGGGKVLVGIDNETKLNQMPRQYTLNQNYPNPFNPTTTITFAIPGEAGKKQHTTLTVYDLRGRHVKTLIDSEREPGTHQVVWNGKNEQGQQVSSGIYLYTLKSGNQIYTRKMVIFK